MKGTVDRCIPGGNETSARFRGYGWPATLELLSFLETAKTVSRFKMIICPACNCVHESSGICLSRHRQLPTANPLGDLSCP